MNLLKIYVLAAILVVGFNTSHAEENIVYSVCSGESAVDVQVKFDFVEKFRYLLSRGDKIVALESSDCIFLRTHPMKEKVIAKFFLLYVKNEISESEVQHYSELLTSLEANSVAKFEFDEFQVEQYKILIGSLYPDVATSIEGNSLTAKGKSMQLLSIEELIKNNIR